MSAEERKNKEIEEEDEDDSEDDDYRPSDDEDEKDNEASADELEDDEEILEREPSGDQKNEEPAKSSKELDEEERKRRADALWADLMGSSTNSKQAASSGQSSQTNRSTKPAIKTSTISTSSTTTDATPTTNTLPTKIKLTKEYEFAGERVRVEEDCSKPENGTADRSTTPKFVPLKRGSGINDLVANLGKRQKLSTLNKSKMDWDMFKQEKGITEDLKNHTKNKNSYVERQAFLQRTDLKQFELEKSIREKNRTRNAG